MFLSHCFKSVLGDLGVICIFQLKLGKLMIDFLWATIELFASCSGWDTTNGKMLKSEVDVFLKIGVSLYAETLGGIGCPHQT